MLTIANSPCADLNRSFVIVNQFEDGEDDTPCLGVIGLCSDSSVADLPPPCPGPSTPAYSIAYGLETGSILGVTKCWLHVDIYGGTILPANRVAGFWTGYLDCPLDCTGGLTLEKDATYDPLYNGCIDGDTTCTMQAI